MSVAGSLKLQRWGVLAAALLAVLLLTLPSLCRAGTAATPAAAAVPAAAPAATDSLENSPLQLPAPGASPASLSNTAAASTDPAPAVSSGATRVAGALVAVVALILLLRWVGQRALAANGGRGGKSAAVRVLSRTMLAPRQQVLLLHVGRRVVVVGDSGGRMSPLCEIADPDEVAALVGASQSTGSEAAKAVFGSVFRRAKEPFADETDVSDPADVLAISHADQPSDDAEPAPVGNLLDKVRLMRNQFKEA